MSVIGKLDKLKETPLEIGVTYTDSAKLGRRHERTFRLDFSENEGLATVGRSPLFEIAKATKDIQRDLRHITTGVYKPIILTEPLSEHRLQKRADSLKVWIDQFPHEIQQEILREVSVVISKREQEAWDEKLREKAQSDTDSS